MHLNQMNKIKTSLAKECRSKFVLNLGQFIKTVRVQISILFNRELLFLKYNNILDKECRSVVLNVRHNW